MLRTAYYLKVIVTLAQFSNLNELTSNLISRWLKQLLYCLFMNEEILARFERRSREKRARISSFMNKQYSNYYFTCVGVVDC